MEGPQERCQDMYQILCSLSTKKIFDDEDPQTSSASCHTIKAMDGYFDGFHRGTIQTNGMKMIMVVVDKLAKYGHHIPLPKHYSVQLMVETFQGSIGRLHSMSQTICVIVTTYSSMHFGMNNEVNGCEYEVEYYPSSLD